MRWAVRTALACLAARPRDAQGAIVLSAAPLFVHDASSAVLQRLRVCGAPLCEHPIFLSLASLVKRLESTATLVSPRTQRQANASATATTEQLRPTLERLDAATTTLHTALHAQQEVIAYNRLE